MNTSNVTNDLEEIKQFFEDAPADIKTLIQGDEIRTVTTELGEKYSLHLDKYIHLSNIIICILIGALDTNNVIDTLGKDLELTPKEATELAQDLEKGILEKARALTVGKPVEEVAVLEFKGEPSKEELREEIMDTTKRDSGIKTQQSSSLTKKTATITPGSRSELLEQLQILSAIPNDEEVEKRLKSIQEQINSIKKEEGSDALESNVALKSFMFGEEGKETAPAILKTATYSVAPTHYNLDPYREVAED